MSNAYIVFDLAEIRYVHQGGKLQARSPIGELLGHADVAADDRIRDACLSALDFGAERTWVWRGGERYRIAYYNPHTAEVSVGSSENGTAYVFAHPVPIAYAGTIAELREDEDGTTRLVLETGEEAAERPVLTYAQLRQRLAANRQV